MKQRYLWQSALAVLALSVVAAANPVSVKFTNAPSELGGPTQGVYYYPYVLSVNSGQSVQVTCDDYYDDTYLNESWNANVYTYNATAGTQSNLSNALFYNTPNRAGESGALAYEQAAWLISQFAVVPPNGNNVNAGINFAIWDLFDPTAPTLAAEACKVGHPGEGDNDFIGCGTDTSSSYWLNAAENANLSNFNFSNFYVITPVVTAHQSHPQEFIGELAGGNQSPVPEPASLALMLGGLALAIGLAWRRQQATV